MLILTRKQQVLQTIACKDRIAVDWLKLHEHNAIIAGGAALRWYQGTPVESADIDIFFKSHRDFLSMQRHIESLSTGIYGFDVTPLDSSAQETKSLGNIIKGMFSITRNDTSINPKPSIHSRKNICSSERAETYEIQFHGVDNPHKIQLIKARYHEDYTDLVNTFDISVCQVATDGVHWYVGEHFIEDMRERRLRIVHQNAYSLKRMIKYWAYGFTPDDETIQRVIDYQDTMWTFEGSELEDYHDL